MKSVYLTLDCFEGKILNFTFRRFYKNMLHRYDDIAPLGYISLLEHKADYESIEDSRERFWRAVSYCSAGMQKYFDKNCFVKFNTISMCELTERHLEEFALSNNVEELENYLTLKDLFKETLFSYSARDKQIICDYLFNEVSKTGIYKKYSINTNYLKELVINVRKDFLYRLIQIGYFSKHKKFINLCKDFEKVEKKKDVLICSLLKERKIPIEQISSITGIPLERVPKILMHTKNNMSFYLYQIQKLRKCYFPEYTLKELAI